MARLVTREVLRDGRLIGFDALLGLFPHPDAWRLITAESTFFRLGFGDGPKHELRGTGFTFDCNGHPTGGTITSWNVQLDNDVHFIATDLQFSATSWWRHYLTEDWSGLLPKILAQADAIIGNRAPDNLLGFAGDDTIRAGEGNDRLLGMAGRDLLKGELGNDRLFGGIGNDTIIGGGGNDRLHGGFGDDRLAGEGGNDILLGGPGADVLIGGAGEDRFLFGNAGHTTNGLVVDLILDFDAADIIDLVAIDADRTAAGDQAFDLIGGAAFSGTAGEIRFASGVLSGDTDGDAAADFSIRVSGAGILNVNDFAL